MADAVPHALLHNLLHNQVLHEQVMPQTVVSEDSPRVTADRRFEAEAYGEGFFRLNPRRSATYPWPQACIT